MPPGSAKSKNFIAKAWKRKNSPAPSFAEHGMKHGARDGVNDHRLTAGGFGLRLKPD